MENMEASGTSSIDEYFGAMGIKRITMLWLFCLLLPTLSQGARICFGELGCIVKDDDWYDRIHRPFSLLPSSRDAIGTVFKLFSRNNKQGVVFGANNIGGNSLRIFDPSKCTKIIIHGFRSRANMDWVMNMTDSLLHRMDVNVITVDWSNGAGSPYIQAVANTRVVGLELAFLINNLIRNEGANPHKFHLIGHSLGAHIAGYAGARVQSLGRITGCKGGRSDFLDDPYFLSQVINIVRVYKNFNGEGMKIRERYTGLDPAGPGFTRMPSYVRLDRYDAKFVDVIHTDAESLGFGLEESIGDVDFFPNGGYHQVGCHLSTYRAWRAVESLWTHMPLPTCSHSRSQELFIESILSSPYLNSGTQSDAHRCPLVGFLCDSYEDFVNGKCTKCECDQLKCSFMGIDADKYPGKHKPYAPKKFFLTTNSSPPYCGYHYAINLTVTAETRGAEQVAGDISATIIGENGVASGISFTPKSRVMNKGETHTFLGFSERSVGHLKSANITWTWNHSFFKNLCFWCADKDLFLSHFSVSNMGICSKQFVETRAACTSNATVDLETAAPTVVPLNC